MKEQDYWKWVELNEIKHTGCPRCMKCKNMTVEFSSIIRKRVLSCKAKRCRYVRKDA